MTVLNVLGEYKNFKEDIGVNASSFYAYQDGSRDGGLEKFIVTISINFVAIYSNYKPIFRNYL